MHATTIQQAARSQFLASILGSGAMRVLAAAASFALNLLLARLLGAQGYGAYAFAISCVLLAATCGKWGWDKAAVRFVAQYLAQGERQRLADFMSASRRAVLVLATLFGLICAAWIAFGSLPVSAGTVAAAALIVPLSSLGLLLQGQLRGARQIIASELPEGLLKPLATAGLTVIVVYSFTALDPVFVAMISSLCAALLANAMALWLLARSLPIGMPASASVHASAWSRDIREYGVLGIAQVGLSRGPIVLAGSVLDPAGIGLVAVASRLGDVVAFAVSSVGIAAAPRIAALYHEGNLQECRRLLSIATRYSIVAGAAICAVMSLGGRYVLQLFGADFAAAFPVLLAMCAAQFVAACCGPVGYLATMSGHQRQAAVIQFVSAGVGALATLVLGKLYGFVGVGMAIALSVAGANLLMRRLSARILMAAPSSQVRQ
ncbi:lipopolysaccharide biosynthesis protein [Povalibacter sp.]|uniref:lipopolysaccharide biosynthesis protein n=1 Tax=Povalibacter sp. TaxID=1962978 RepID=UPI002F41CC50